MKYLCLLLIGILFSFCTPKMEETFPFNQTDKIEVISYPVRYNWDTIRDGKKVYLGDLVENKRLVNPSGIKERITLNDKQKQDLFSKLFIRETKDCTVAACFDPRHAILFYNEKSEIIAYIEICFDCGYDRGSRGFKYNDICYEGMAALKPIFQEAGIKYYGDKK